MTSQARPFLVRSPSGLAVQVNANGSLRRMDYRDVVLNLFLGNELEGGVTNVYLRVLGDDVRYIPLLGPRSTAIVEGAEDRFTAHGEWSGLRFAASLVLARSAPAWFWHVVLEHQGSGELTVDLIYAQDLALAPYGSIRLNEYYVSQYLDYTPLAHGEHGTMLGVRQNLAMGGRNPWALIGALGRGVSFATDALQLYGLEGRARGTAEALARRALPGKRLQHEHSMAVLQHAPVKIAAGTSAHAGFFGWLEEHHASPTTAADVAFCAKALSLPEASLHGSSSEPVAHGTGNRDGEASHAATFFSDRPLLHVLDLTDAEIDQLFDTPRRDVERGADGSLLSFFTGPNGHVVLRAKETSVLRPHGHIMRTGDRLVPDEASLTSTAWMAGVFHSMLTQGHVSINRLLSTTHGYLGLFRSHGLRIFMELADGFHLLDVPSAFEASPSGCRWVYKHAAGAVQVRSWAPVSRHEMNLTLEVSEGAACRFLLSHHVSLNGDDGSEPAPAVFERDDAGITLRPIPDSDLGRRFPSGSFRIDFAPAAAVERATADEYLFVDGLSRNQPYVCVVTTPVTEFGLRITGGLVEATETPRANAAPLDVLRTDEDEARRYWKRAIGDIALAAPERSTHAVDAARTQEILPWFAHDALIHYLAPRGLEQYSGGGWGTRDVCQGPLEMLLALSRWDAARDLLVRVFKTQNADGDWPQWFMFFERERNIRPGDSHGDIVFWPLLALAQYLAAAEDASILEEVVPFFHPEGDHRAEEAPIWQHLERALGVIRRRIVPGTRLAAYGHGDWNDSLQPLDPSMREGLCSSWTVTLHYQTFRALAEGLTRAGRRSAAARLQADADLIYDEFHRCLIVDGVLAGYAYFHEDGQREYLLHPRDADIHYSVLAIIHSIIADLLTPDEAEAHIALIRRHLLGPDGVHLFDRPFRYRGGEQRRFQRAESSTFFGREIGNMYMHAHLRYAEAMAHYGDAEAFFLALRQANPIGMREVVPSAALRQRNCYYSSSDPAFADRYEGYEQYGRVRLGEVPLEGGWRVYSSGAGIAFRLIRERLLGLCRQKSTLVVDPVMPTELDGMRARLDVGGRRLNVSYRVGQRGCGPAAVLLDGKPLPFDRGPNRYRTGAAHVAMLTIETRARDGSVLDVELE